MYRLRIPYSLDIEDLLSKVPAQFKGFKIDKVHWVCNAIYAGSLSLNKRTHIHPLKQEPHFVPLRTDILGHYLGREYYTNIMRWMVAAGVIECDNHYQTGIVSKGYRFTERYRADLSRTVTLTNSKLAAKRKPRKAYDPDFEESASIQSLRLWFSKLSIDRQAALEVIEKMHETAMKTVRTKDHLLKVISRYNNTCSVVDMFDENMSDYCYQDLHGRRLHTVLTQLPKYLRSFVRYDGKELAQTDLSNSQLFFTLYLLDVKNWNSSTNCQMQRLLNNTKTNQTPSYSIMSPAFDQSGNNIKLFTELVSSGKIYDHFIPLMEKQLGFFRQGLTYEQKRTQIKSLLIAQINGDYSLIDPTAKQYDFGSVGVVPERKKHGHKSHLKNVRLYIGRNYRLWESFRSEFPEISELYMKIKRNNNADLSRILQRVESMFVLDIACQEVAQKCQEIALFTMHDCLITTIDRINELDAILKSSIAQRLGAMPSTKIKHWSGYSIDYSTQSKAA